MSESVQSCFLSLQGKLKHKEWYVAACVFSFLNAVTPPITQSILADGWQGGLSSGGGISFVVWFSLFIGFSLLFQGCKRFEISRLDKLICALFMGLCLIPSALVCWCALFLLSVYLFFQNRYSNKLKAGFIILAVVAIRIPFIQFCLSVFSGPLLEIDAFFVSHFLSVFLDDVYFEGNIVYTQNDYSLGIMTGCSSFDNMSLALLLWFTLVYSNQFSSDWKRILYVFWLSVIIIFINTIRLSLMAWTKEFYEFFHSDTGLMLIEVVLLLTAILMALYTKRSKRGIIR